METKKENVWATPGMKVYLGLAICLYSQHAYAYGDQIETALNTTITWVARVIGGAVFAFGLVQFFSHLMADDPNAWKMARNKIIAGLGFGLIPEIVALVKSFTGK